MIRGILFLALLSSAYASADCVVLLHGLARSSGSMEKLADALEEEGYDVVNLDYPSRRHPIEVLADKAAGEGFRQCPPGERVHYVTHSLGGILVRYHYRNEVPERLGRVVMLAPPNQGSEVVDVFGELPGFNAFNGPAGMQLGTGEDSIPGSLGPVSFETGVIAGSSSINLILSQALPNPDDGKVSVASTRVEGMTDFLVVDHTHPMIMRADEVIEQTVSFLKTGKFVHQ